MVKSLITLVRSDNGFDPNGVLTMELKVSRSRYRDRAELSRFLHQALQTVQSQPGVEKATISAHLPGVSTVAERYRARRARSLEAGEQINVDWSIVSADYFQTMKIPILRGRTFTRDEDEQGKPVVLVDENSRASVLAQRRRGRQTPQVRQSDVARNHRRRSGSARAFGSETKPLIKMYTPMGRKPQRNSTLLIRYNNIDVQALTAAVTRSIQAIDKGVPVAEVATFESILAREASPRRFNAVLFAIRRARTRARGHRRLRSAFVFGVATHA